MNEPVDKFKATPADSKPMATSQLVVSVVLPCLNEAETLAICIRQAADAMKDSGLPGEIIVADNGSTDGSQQIAADYGARVVPVVTRGYGAALWAGITSAHGKYVVMGDSDASYDFRHIPAFVAKLREGYQLVIGNRFSGKIFPGAMPPLHRYLGNPVLTWVGRLFFQVPSGDFHCGLRAFDRLAITNLDLRTTGMEFASEMIIKARLAGLAITEIPTTLAPDGRSRPPHLRSWRDGWRHLRFMLLYSPRWLFFWPGLLLILTGTIGVLWLAPGPRNILGVTFDVHTMLFAGAAIVVGFQSVLFAVLAKVFAVTEGLLPPNPHLQRLVGSLSLEAGLLVGLLLLLAGLGISVSSIFVWRAAGFGDLNPAEVLRLIIPAIVFIIVGCQTMLGSFFLSVLGLARR